MAYVQVALGEQRSRTSGSLISVRITLTTTLVASVSLGR